MYLKCILFCLLVSISSLTINSYPVSATNHLTLELITDGFSRLNYLTHNSNSNQLFLVEQSGKVKIVENSVVLDTPFLDATSLLNEEALSQEPHGTGLLGLAFHPDYDENGQFLIVYTDAPDANLTIARFRHEPNQPYPISLSNPDILLTIPQDFPNHNGGQLLFGSDGLLYVALGDGGPNGGDPYGNAQNSFDWRGSILRIDVDTANNRSYNIPPDNPFADGFGGLPEIWVYGFRHPWRVDIDRLSDTIFISDIGEAHRHEVNIIPLNYSDSPNFGWQHCEGTVCFTDTNQNTLFASPMIEYDYSSQHCAITGGIVYRGEGIPELYGSYLYADFCSGEIWHATQATNREWTSELILNSEMNIVSFGQDRSGEIYVLSDTAVYKIISDL